MLHHGPVGLERIAQRGIYLTDIPGGGLQQQFKLRQRTISTLLWKRPTKRAYRRAPEAAEINPVAIF